MKPTVFLLDMDGVLVKPGGYRASVRATVNYFSNQLGLGNIAPDDETIALFEAEGITCEWDMVPILLAMAIEAALDRSSHLQEKISLTNLQTACDWLSRNPVHDFSIDFSPLLRGLNRFVRVGEAPAESLLKAVRSGQAGGLFTRLSRQPLLDHLLSNTRHLALSQTTLVFETFALGHAALMQATGLPAAVQSASLLVQYDEPLLLPETRDRLRQWQSDFGLKVAAYTARPSAPDDGLDHPLAVFAPEAEMALERIGWPELMVVGAGQAGEMAWTVGVGEDRFTKPSPYHAVAAIAAAWTGDRKAALNWTEQVFCYFEQVRACSPSILPALMTSAGALPEQLDLHIFEDSPAGMHGGILAAELLAELGMQVTLNLWGVSSHPEKVAALSGIGAQVFPNINQAVGAALKTIVDS